MTTFREAITYIIETERGLALENGDVDDYDALGIWLKQMPKLKEDNPSS